MRSLLIGAFVVLSLVAFGQRKLNSLPDIPGYQTLKADFHVHTDFSDGSVWPTFRVDEAAREGIDIIALTDHIEVLPHKDYIKSSLNASYNIALPAAKEKNIILIHACEITRPMPTGHFNALFIQDADKLVNDDFMKVVEEAINQGAFIFWNHPGWKTQQPDGIPKFHQPQEEMYKKDGFMELNSTTRSTLTTSCSTGVFKETLRCLATPTFTLQPVISGSSTKAVFGP